MYNAKRRRQRERQKKKSVGVIGEKKNILCTCSTLFCTFLCRRCCNVKLPSFTSYGENLVCGYNKICCLYCCSLFFSFFSLPPPPVYHIVLPTKFVSFVDWVTCILNWYPFGAGGRADGHVTTSH